MRHFTMLILIGALLIGGPCIASAYAVAGDKDDAAKIAALKRALSKELELDDEEREVIEEALEEILARRQDREERDDDEHEEDQEEELHTEEMEEQAEAFEQEMEEMGESIEEWAEGFEKGVEDWAERFEKQIEEGAEEWAAGFEAEMEEWAERFSASWEEWAETHEEDWEEWGEKYAQRWEDWAEELEEGNVDEETLQALVGENLEMLGEMPLEELYEQIMRSTEQIQDLPWHQFEKMEELIRDSIEHSLHGVEEMQVHLENDEHQEAVRKLHESLDKLRAGLDAKRGELGLAAKKAVADLEKHADSPEARSAVDSYLADHQRHAAEHVKQQLKQLKQMQEFHLQDKAQLKQMVEKINQDRDQVRRRDSELTALREEISRLRKEIESMHSKDQND